MKREIFSILFALVLVVSMGLVTSVPAVACRSEPEGWAPYYFVQRNVNGSISWATDSAVGSSCLVLSATEDEAQSKAFLAPPLNVLNNLSTISVWHKNPDFFVYVMLWVDFGGEGSTDFRLVAELPKCSDWTQTTIGDDAELASVSLSKPIIWEIKTLAEWKTTVIGQVTVGEEDLNWIAVGLDWHTWKASAGSLVNVDDVTVTFSGSSYTFEMEPKVHNVNPAPTPWGDVPEWFSKIQVAIAKANPGDTISVAPGTYAETVTIGAGLDNLTLQGTNPANTVITNGIKFDTNAGDITGVSILDFTIRGNAGTYGNGVTVGHIGSGYLYDLTFDNNIFVGQESVGMCAYINPIAGNFTFTNNEVTGYTDWGTLYVGEATLKAGSDGPSLAQVTFQGNYIHDNRGSSVVYGNADNFTDEFIIQGNEFRNNGGHEWFWAAIEVRNADNVLVENNFFEGSPEGMEGVHGAALYFTNDSNGLISGDVVHNDFLSNYQGIYVFSGNMSGLRVHFNNFQGNDTAVDAIGEENPSGNLDATKNWWGAATGPYHATTNPSGAGNPVSDNVYYSPWCAVEDTDPVTAGYQPPTPMVWGVSTNGTIQEAIDAANAGDTVLVHPGTYEETVELDVEGLTIQSSDGPLVTTVKGHKHEGAGWWGPIGYYDIAFQVIASGVTIEGFTIDQDRSMLDDPVWTGFNRPAIMIGGWFPGDYGHLGVERVVIRDNIFTDIWSAIYIWKSSYNLISGSKIDGCYWRSIQIYDGSDDGQLAYDPGYSYSNPPIRDWQGNLLSFTTGELIYPSQYNRIVGNEIAYGQFGGIFVGAWPPGGGLWTDNTGTEITGNYIHNDSDIAMGTAFSSGSKAFSENIIESCRIGIYIFGDGATGVAAYWNDIVGNTEFGVLNETPGTIDATYNWWGDASGPTHTSNALGTGDPVSDNVVYSPWLGATLGTTPMTFVELVTGTDPDPVTLVDDEGNTIATVDISGGDAAQGTIAANREVGDPEPGGISLMVGTGRTGVVFLDVRVSGYTSGMAHITVPYPDADDNGIVDGTDIEETTLRLYYWDEATSRWYPARNNVVATVNNTVSGSIPVGALGGTPIGVGGYPAAPAPTPPVPPPMIYLEINLFGRVISFSISETGEMPVTRTATSLDGNFTITIPDGTIALDKDGSPLSTLTIDIDDSPPDPPEDAHIIGLAYNFDPRGASFEPPIELIINYDPEELPENVSSVFIAYYDEGRWTQLEPISGFVDVAGTATGQVSHFTTFAVIATVTPPLPPPAAFSVSNLSVQPLEVQPKQVVTITISVANIGGTEGSYTAVLMINDVMEAEKSLTVAAGSSQSVSFSVTREDAGSYSVGVNGLSGSFTVKEKPSLPPAKPPISWPVVGGIIAAVVVAAMCAFFLIKRRGGLRG